MVLTTTVGRLALAALVSGATAGSLLVLSHGFSPLLTGSPASAWAFAMLIEGLLIGLLGGLTVASLPAFVAGATMWRLGESYDAARHPCGWAAAGAAVGGGLWALFALLFGTVGRGGLDVMEVVLLAAGLIAGAGAALAFLGVMRLSGGPRRAARAPRT